MSTTTVHQVTTATVGWFQSANTSAVTRSTAQARGRRNRWTMGPTGPVPNPARSASARRRPMPEEQ
jgi:hypothetical protein